jgi:hypothetical protein
MSEADVNSQPDFVKKPVGQDNGAPTLSFELHPACSAWPEMSPKELRDLSDDIFENGLREPVTLTPEGKLLDGRNRALACVMAGREPTTVVYYSDPWLFSLSKNKHRRHMTVDQIALVAARLATRGEGGDGSNQHGRATSSSEPVAPSGLSIADAAKEAGVPETAIKSAKTVLKHGAPEEIEAVRTGQAPLRKTADAVRERMRPIKRSSLAPPIGKLAQASSRDPIDGVVRELTAQCGDGRWRSLSKIASKIQFAISAIDEALERLGEGVSTRTNAHGDLEYRIDHWPAPQPDTGAPQCRTPIPDPIAGIADLADKVSQGNLRRELDAARATIADLQLQLAAKDTEIAKLTALLDAATAPPPSPRPNKKAGRAKAPLSRPSKPAPAPAAAE